MSSDQNKAVLRRWFDALNHKDLKALEKLADETFTAGCFILGSGSMAELGPEGVKKWLHQVMENPANMHITIDDMLAEGDKVTIRFTVQDIDPASGEPISSIHIYIYRMVAGQIAEIWAVDLPGKW